MILLLDAGNSHLKWALWDGAGLSGQGRCEYKSADLRARLQEAWSALPAPEAVVVANVGGDKVARGVRDWAQEQWGIDPRFPTSPAAGEGVRNAYLEPARLGVDRWAALVASRALYPRPACIVDCGTAVTVDAISGEGEHLGGLILPGLGMMRRALVANTRGISSLGEGVSGEVSLLARGTRDGVIAGTLYTLVAALDRIVGDVLGELGPRAQRVITGGDAPALLPLLAGQWKHEPDLVLHGLARIWGVDPA